MTQTEHMNMDNLLHPENIANPYQLYKYLRTHDPIHWNTYLNGWMITRYEDIMSLAQDTRLSTMTAFEYTFKRSLSESEQVAVEQVRPYVVQSMLNMNPPEHTMQRAVLAEQFTPRSLEHLRSDIRRIADQLLDEIQPRGEVELISQFAYPFLFAVIFELLGLPASGRDLFQRGLAMVSEFNSSADPAPGGLEKFAQALGEIEDYLQPFIIQKRMHPTNDLISVMIEAQKQGILSEKEISVLCVQLIFAAHETTANVIGNGMLALLKHPEQKERLEADPELLSIAVEELLRFGNPAQLRPRIALEPIEIAGRLILEGQRVFLILGSANYDECHYSNPETFDVGEQRKRIMTFGHGIHYCLGAHLARLELQVVIPTLLCRLPNLRLSSEAIEWRPNFLLRGLKSLPLLFDAISGTGGA